MELALQFLGCVLVGVLLGLAFAWIRAQRAAPPVDWPVLSDWTDPRNAPPAFQDVLPHAYETTDGLGCCLKCGGGSLHSVHRS